jgi:hypothetical protein
VVVGATLEVELECMYSGRRIHWTKAAKKSFFHLTYISLCRVKAHLFCFGERVSDIEEICRAPLGYLLAVAGKR